MIELDKELIAALTSIEVRRAFEELVRRVVREELQDSPMLDELVDVEEAAALLGISKSAVWKAAERGRLPSVRHGRRVRFRRSDLVRPRKG